MLPRLILLPALTGIALWSLANAQNVVAPYSTSWEAGEGGWAGQVKNWDCGSGCPTATISFYNSLAKLTGNRGLSVRVTVPSSEAWHVQVQSPGVTVTTGNIYTACVWLRSAAAVSGVRSVGLNLLNKTDTYDSLGYAGIQVATNWQQLCMSNLLAPANCTAYFTIDLGMTVGTVYFDDFTLTSTPVSLVPTAPWAAGFESGQQAGWSLNVRYLDCPCPTATAAWGSLPARRSGARGLALAIQSVAGADGWDVQLNSPQLYVTPDRMYSACMWIRSVEPVNGGGHAPFAIKQWGTWDIQTTAQTLISTNWTQICLGPWRPPAPMLAYLSLDLGGLLPLATTVHIDDVTFTSRLDTAAADRTYVSAAAVAGRISTLRRGAFTFNLVNGTTGQPVTRNLTRLELVLSRHDFPFGTSAEWLDVDGAAKDLAWYTGRMKRHFNTLVPGYMFKWPSYEPTPNSTQWTYDYLNTKMVAFAQQNDFVMVRGHTLEWPTAGYDFPAHWSRQDGCNAYRTYLERRIKREVSAFRGKFNSYDVYNEIVHERQFIEGCQGMWPAILFDGFRWAHEADPTAQLCLNDYNLVTAESYPTMVQYIKAMLAAGVPVHCIGVQAYISTESRSTPAIMRQRFEALAATGLPLLVTEFNFYSYWDEAAGQPVWAGSEQEHADLYNEYIPFWYSLPYVRGIIMWGFWDTANWIRDGGVYRADGTPKLSATAIDALWRVRWRSSDVANNVSLPLGQRTVRGFYGRYTYKVVVGGKTYTGNREFKASGGAAQSATITIT